MQTEKYDIYANDESNVRFLSSTIKYSKKRKTWVATAKFEMLEGKKRMRRVEGGGLEFVNKNSPKFKISEYFRDNRSAVNWVITMRYTTLNEDIFNRDRYKFLNDDKVLVKKGTKKWTLVDPDRPMFNDENRHYELSHIDFSFYTNPQYVAFNMAFRTDGLIRTAVKSNMLLTDATKQAVSIGENPTRSYIRNVAKYLERKCVFTNPKKYEGSLMAEHLENQSNEKIVDGVNVYLWEADKYYLMNASVTNYVKFPDANGDWRLTLEYQCGCADKDPEVDTDSDEEETLFINRWFDSKNDTILFLASMDVAKEFVLGRSKIKQVEPHAFCKSHLKTPYKGLMNTEIKVVDDTPAEEMVEAVVETLTRNYAVVPEWQSGEYMRGSKIKHNGLIWSALKLTKIKPPINNNKKQQFWDLVGVCCDGRMSMNYQLTATMEHRTYIPGTHYPGNTVIWQGGVWEANRQTDNSPELNHGEDPGDWKLIGSVKFPKDYDVPEYADGETYKQGWPVRIGNSIWLCVKENINVPPETDGEASDAWFLLCVMDMEPTEITPAPENTEATETKETEPA